MFDFDMAWRVDGGSSARSLSKDPFQPGTVRLLKHGKSILCSGHILIVTIADQRKRQSHRNIENMIHIGIFAAICNLLS